MTIALLLGLLVPLAGFLVLLTTANWIGRRLTGWIACTAVLIAFLCFSGILVHYSLNELNPMTIHFFQWIPLDPVKTDFSLRIDTLSILMTLIITGVGFLIHVYSIGYIEHEEDYARFFACMNFFVFMMLLLVLAGNLLLLFVGWEGVGLASFLLIGYWYHRPSAAQAATKAFVVNRIGDLGFLLGILLTFQLFGSSDFDEISHHLSSGFAVGAPIITVLALLYFVGAVGKSAQIPLHVWLPDAMEGPTPVSALIHAATMVTAGVYVVVRMHSIYLLTPDAMLVVGIIGAVTALFASLCALGQTDLKRVLAYSTVSQLGYMFLACGVGAFYAAMFHLTAHAFIKALLFLSAGNVVHMMHGSTDMEKMGGLSKQFNKTHILFLIGVLALSGIPPFAAFFSKDLILEQEYETGFYILLWIGMITAVITAFYLMRAYCLTFMGGQKLEEKILQAVKEAPRIMLVPVTILAFLSLVGGFLGFSIGTPSPLEDFLAESEVMLAGNRLSHGFHIDAVGYFALAGAILAIIAATIVYTKYPDRIGKTIQFLKKSFYVDEIYEYGIVKPLKALANLIANTIEPRVFEGSIDQAAKSTQYAAGLLQRFQSGQIRSYIAWVAIGMVILVIYLFI